MVKKWLVTLLIAVIIALLLIGYKLLDKRATAELAASAPEYSETVAAAQVVSVAYQPTVSVLGKVIAPQQVELRNELAGIVAEVSFESGAQVKKDQLLLQLNVSEERAQLQSAIARAELAQATKNRIAKLRDSRAVSQEQYDKADAELRYAAAEKAIIEASIAKKTLRAPFDAVTGLHQFETGQYLEENTLVTTLIGVQDYLWVDFSLPQIYAALPTDAAVTLAPLTGGKGSIDWAPVPARVIARESVMKAESRSLRYRAQVQKGETGLLANAVVSVQVAVAKSQHKLAIPAIAVLHSSAGPYVYLLNEDTSVEMQPAYRAQRQPVTLGAQQGDLMIIESGLQLGQRIASAGSFKLSDGLLAFLAPPPPTETGAIEATP